MNKLDLESCKVHDLIGCWVLPGADPYGCGVLSVEDPKGSMQDPEGCGVLLDVGPKGILAPASPGS